jgi:hypothetical protein
MKVFTPRRRNWTTVLLGAYLFIAPWIFGTLEDEASSANAWIVGACIVVATLRVPIVSGPRAARSRGHARSSLQACRKHGTGVVPSVSYAFSRMDSRPAWSRRVQLEGGLIT